MEATLIEQVSAAIAGRKSWEGLACESPLRVAASMLAHASPSDTTATRVVGAIGPDDIDACEQLVADIADEYGLRSHFEIRRASYAVRFWRP